MSYQHPFSELLRLIDISGPFLAEPVLEKAFPQGLNQLDSLKKKRFRQTYDEWREAVDTEDTLVPQIHKEWVSWVLKQGLELDTDEDGDVLKTADDIPAKIALSLPEHGLTCRPDYAVIDNQSPDQALLLVSSIQPGTDLDAAEINDGWVASSIDRMVRLCRATKTRLGLVTNGERWALIDAPEGGVVSVASWYARYWGLEPLTLQAFVSLLEIRTHFSGIGPEAKKLHQLLDESLEHQDKVTDALGEQVSRAVEVLIQALDRSDIDRDRTLLDGVEPAELYEAGLTVMMRLVFLLCAEERGLLPTDSKYNDYYAVATLRGQLRRESDEVLERRWDAWSRLLAIFRAVYGGIEHESLSMPALGGSLFDPDRFPFLEGRAKDSNWKHDAAAPLPIDNRTVLLLLEAIQLYQGRTLSYLALDVEQIGYVYEGLLERTVKRADEVTLELDFTRKSKKPWVTIGELESAQLDGPQALEKLLVERTGSSASRVRKDLDKAVDDATETLLLTACNGDQTLRDRIKSYCYLLRTDRWGYPIVYPKNAFMVTTGTDRRETGAHYTPKSLTEAIVEETLIPVAYVGPAEGAEKVKWKLKSPAELLDLKICDPAMGSGAFLVQVCRWLSERLVESWSEAEKQGKIIGTEGAALESLGSEIPLSCDVEERSLTAKRLIAERCLYGVDMNPLAVELAKLSIWLVTLAKGRPFGFLDHNFKHGDSLLGVHRLDQIQCLDMWVREDRTPMLFAQNITQAVTEAVELRKEIRNHPIHDIRDVEAMAHLDDQARQKLKLPELIADALVGEVLKERSERAVTAVLSIEVGGALEGKLDRVQALERRANVGLSSDLPAGKPRRTPFHWPLEFPEVFIRENGAFDAIVGNPPFLGNKFWSGALGALAQWQMHMVLKQAPGKIDLCVAFHRRAADLIRESGSYGLLATSNLSEGSSIDVGLGVIVNQGDIYAANKGMPWPGKAAVIVAIVCFFKNKWNGVRKLDGNHCDRIGPRLKQEAENLWDPKKINNGIFGFAGVDNSKGMAFAITSENNWFDRLKSEKDSLLRPYITGDDITSYALNRVSRWALDIENRSLEDIRINWPSAYQFLVEEVQSTRSEDALKSYDELYDRWWQFWRHRTDLMSRLRNKNQCITYSKNTKYPVCMIAPTSWIYTNKVLLLGIERDDQFAICLSSFFRYWLEAYSGGNLGVTLTLSITQSISKFPLPTNSVSDVGVEAAKEFNEILISWGQERGCGITAFMNKVNSPDCNEVFVIKARRCLEIIDCEVLSAYGWTDFDIVHDFIHISEAPELDSWRYVVSESVSELAQQRLLALNKEYYGRERKKPYKKSGPPSTLRKKKPKASEPIQQVDLFETSESSIKEKQPGNKWGGNAVDQIYAWLEASEGKWFTRKTILKGSGAAMEGWEKAIKELIADGDIEQQGSGDEARYRAKV